MKEDPPPEYELPPTYNEAVLKNLSVIGLGTAKNEDVEQSHL